MLHQLVQVADDARQVGVARCAASEAHAYGFDQDADPDELLADVVVQIEAEPLPFLLPDAHLSVREQSQLLPARAQRFLRLPALGDVATDAADSDDSAVRVA